MGISACAAGGMPPGTFDSLPSPPPADTSSGALPNGTWNQCSQHACREHYPSHSSRGHRSGGLISVPWPMAAARCPDWSNLRSWMA